MYQMFPGRVGAAFFYFIHFVVVVGYSLNNNNKKNIHTQITVMLLYLKQNKINKIK